MDTPSAIVLAAYAALGVELVFLAVPSDVSTRQLLRRPDALGFAAGATQMLRFTLMLLLFVIPPTIALIPGMFEQVVPITALGVPPVRWAGVGLLVFSRIWTPLALPPLRRALDQGTLARSGLFAYSRNPVLVGMFAFYLGNALVFPCAVLFAGFPLYVLFMHRRVLMEEELLRARFPHEYDEYAAHAPRYVGFRSAFQRLPT